jgi:3-hydroxyacyl-CoA dehydrogenase/enoyl-CoA hydratase/3-hydroxybutyryl-CoA epimerase/3-hydroxyacyl-CoA dehydrogenase/enoyl-CoA hydratase/3-hydroxybutyryl-CoA epimerase/enoyl-CoA isomerase
MPAESPAVFRFEERPDKVGVLYFDSPGQKVNTFTHAALAQLDNWVSKLAKRTDLRGLILTSGKPGTFIAGADLEELLLGASKRAGGGDEVTRLGQGIFNRLSELPFPTVAAIDGAAMGGGLEIALACDFRIASTNKATQIGLPETKIGIIPGWGGTQRLTRVAGVSQAVEMITTGEPVDGKKALEIGLAFDAVPPDRLLDEAARLIGLAHESPPSPQPSPPAAGGEGRVRGSGPLDWQANRRRMQQPIGLTEDQAHFIFGVAHAMVMAKTEGHYPAPVAALEVVRKTVNVPLADGLKVEAAAIAPLVTSGVAVNLIRIFFATRRLAKDPGVDNPNIKPRDIRRVGVVGGGLMGSGITTAMIRRGVPVTLIEANEELLQKGVGRVRGNMEGRVKAGRMSPGEVLDTLARITPTVNQTLLGDCDFLLEAITENEQAKQELFRKIDGIVSKDAIIASNTSTIPISRLAENVSRPERFVGMHYFNPADRMQLVEVIRGAKSSDETVAATVALAKKIGKTPVVVKDCPGFLVNRILMPYMNEALLLVEEGAPLAAIDKSAKAFGMPMGPITLHDVVGMDTALFAGRVVAAAYSDRMFEPKILAALVAAGRLGQKSGAGFFAYPKGSMKGKPDPAFDPLLAKVRGSSVPPREYSPQELQDRLFLPMLIEASRALAEGIARSPEDLDMSLILGLGFPAFRGGLLRWADSLGAAKLLETIKPYEKLGKRFEPSELLKDLARTGKKFYAE